MLHNKKVLDRIYESQLARIVDTIMINNLIFHHDQLTIILASYIARPIYLDIMQVKDGKLHFQLEWSNIPHYIIDYSFISELCVFWLWHVYSCMFWAFMPLSMPCDLLYSIFLSPHLLDARTFQSYKIFKIHSLFAIRLAFLRSGQTQT